MADSKISGLTAATTVADADVLAGVNGTTTRKFALSTLAAYMSTKLTTAAKTVVASDAPTWWQSIPGAVICDGTNDDVEINAAIVAATNSGANFGTVRLSPGTYYVGKNSHPQSSTFKYGILLYSKLTLECPDFLGATIKFANGTFNNVTTLMSDTGVAMNFNITSAGTDANITLRGIVFDWNAAGQGAGNGLAWGTLDVGSAVMLQRVDYVTLDNCAAKNARATNGSSPSFNLSVNTNGTTTVTLAANVPAGNTVAVGDVVAFTGATASLPTNTVVTVTAVSGQTSGSTITLSQTVTGTASAQTLICKAVYEKWDWKLNNCRRIKIINSIAYSDDAAHYAATGLGAQYCNEGYVEHFEAHHCWHGMNNHESANIRFAYCHVYLNNAAGALCEYSRNVSYVGCIFGGKSNQLSSTFADIPANTALGNGTYGINWDGSENIRVSDCVASYNGSSGFSFNDNTDPESGGLSTRGTLANCIATNNGAWGFIFNGTTSSTRWTLKNFAATSNTSGDIWVGALSGGAKGWSFPVETGGPVPANRTPAIAGAYNANLTNPFPFTVAVLLTIGSNYSVAVDGATLGSFTTGEVVSLFLSKGSTINLGASASGGSWAWQILS